MIRAIRRHTPLYLPERERSRSPAWRYPGLGAGQLEHGRAALMWHLRPLASCLSTAAPPEAPVLAPLSGRPLRSLLAASRAGRLPEDVYPGQTGITP